MHFNIFMKRIATYVSINGLAGIWFVTSLAVFGIYMWCVLDKRMQCTYQLAHAHNTARIKFIAS